MLQCKVEPPEDSEQNTSSQDKHQSGQAQGMLVQEYTNGICSLTLSQPPSFEEECSTVFSDFTSANDLNGMVAGSRVMFQTSPDIVLLTSNNTCEDQSTTSHTVSSNILAQRIGFSDCVEIFEVPLPKMEISEEILEEEFEEGRNDDELVSRSGNVVQPWERELSSSIEQPGSFDCSFCEKIFPDEISRATHESVHDCFDQDQNQTNLRSDIDYGNDNSENVNETNDYLSSLKGSGEFACEQCSLSFPRQHLLKVHAHKAHGENAFACLICGEKCPTRKSLTKHKQEHVVDGAFKCETCGFSQLKYTNFLRHLKLHSGTRDYTCEWCGKSFTTSTVLIRHRRRHTGEKPYSCDECGETFARLYGLKVHQSKHIGKGYHCTENNCSKAFYSKSALNNHLKSHLPDRPYKCIACGLGFYMSSHYKDHLRKHTGEKPFVCDVCSKAFSRNGELVIHKRTHTGERPYTCSECNKGFIQKSVLKQHLLSHSKEKLLKCSECDRLFKHQGALKRHMKCAHRVHEPSKFSSDSLSCDESETKDDANNSLDCAIDSVHVRLQVKENKNNK